jgi:hypothetical protein
MKANRSCTDVDYPSAITVGESPFSHDAAELIKYVHPSRNELHMIFQFELADLGMYFVLTMSALQLRIKRCYYVTQTLRLLIPSYLLLIHFPRSNA